MSTDNASSTNHTILIVDDEAISREIFEGFLTPEGYTIILVESGEEALQYLEENQVDLILLDIMMPQMDGIEVCQRVKSDARWKKIPVILATSFWDQHQMDRAIAAGAESFLPKPVNGDDLRAQIRLLL